MMKPSSKNQSKEAKTSPVVTEVEENKEKISRFDSIRHKLSQLSLTLFNTKMSLTKVEKLEKDALRGKGREMPEAKIVAKPKKKVDLLSLILRSEHKSTQQGTQIIKLPKLPFGKHKSYNEETVFKEKHFLEETTQVTSEKMKDLEDITRKFRLYEKKYKGNNNLRLSTATPMLSNFAFVDVYDMGPGQLICAKDRNIINSYERDKLKYKKDHGPKLMETYRDLSLELSDNRKNKRFESFKQQQELLDRLMPSNEIKDTELSMFYSTKFYSLFEDENKKAATQSKYRRSSMN